MTDLAHEGAIAPSGATGWSSEVEAQLRTDAAAIIARYPDPRSALLPMLHLVQSVDAFVSPRGIALCAEVLDLTRAEVSAVATFYSQYKRKPNGRYTVGVCTNTLCAVMGGDDVYDAVSSHLGIGHDETTADGAITLERVECNAACDYAPVVMVNWEFFDNATPTGTVDLVDALVAGEEVTASRGPVVADFRSVSRVLAGFEDGLVDGGATPGRASLVGLQLAREHGWAAPAFSSPEPAQPDRAYETTSAETGAAVAAGAQAGTEAVGKVQSSSERPEPIGQAETTGADQKAKQRETSGEEGADA